MLLIPSHGALVLSYVDVLTVAHDRHRVDSHEQAIQGCPPGGVIYDLALVALWLLHENPDVHVVAAQVKAVRF